ncbi:MAG: metal-dependent hydrolase [Saprospiraceae bacterium]
MDSLTQIVLGAAVSEAALGKKVGNRAIVWGAIAGTIPDLDVIANRFLSPIDALAFHRGPTHGIGFSVGMAILMGVGVHYLYKFKYHKYVGMVSWLLLVWSVIAFLLYKDAFSVVGKGIEIAIGVGLSYFIYQRYQRASYDNANASISGWIWMFFLALFTHPILDTFTTYGTRLFWPFTDTRFALNNISIADPIYTIPFLFCVLVVIFLRRGSKARKHWNVAGLYISSLYMLFTLFNKSRINMIFENTMLTQGIVYDKYMTSPTILNNILWYGIAETDTTYVYGHYSFFDKEKQFKLHSISKTLPRLDREFANDRTYHILEWFSNGYGVLTEGEANNFWYQDLRFGTFRANRREEESFVFKFPLKSEAAQSLTLEDQGRGPRDGNISEALSLLFERIKGI